MAEPTKTHPFFQSPFSRHPGGANRRRSTRLDLVLPVVLSGRDASGEIFREETETATVNLHGAKIATARNILVGMQVTIENLMTGVAEKAVCVRVYERAPGESKYFIATQLVRPGNIWGIEDPPEDWTVVAESMLGKASAASRSPIANRTEPAESVPAMPILESQAVTAEQQSSSLAESILEVFRQQLQVVANAALQSFENRLKQIEAEAAERIRDGTKESLNGASSVLDAMCEDAASQMSAQSAEAIAAAEQEIRARVAEILAPLTGIGAGITAERPARTLSRK
ncbi:MAG: hypothetical protein ACM3NO_11465 [Deltaproteobacteria bacterium]